MTISHECTGRRIQLVTACLRSNSSAAGEMRGVVAVPVDLIVYKDTFQHTFVHRPGVRKPYKSNVFARARHLLIDRHDSEDCSMMCAQGFSVLYQS